MAVYTVALEAGAEGLQRQGPEYPVNGELGAIPLGALGVWDELRGGGDQVRRVAVGALDAPGQVLERDPRHQPVLPGGAGGRHGRSNLPLLTQANVLHQERSGDGHRDGDEGEDEASVERIREAFPGHLEDLLDELLPTGEGRSHAIQGVAGLVAHQRVRVFQGIYQSSGSLRRGIVHKVVSVTRGHERADNCRANRRAQRTDELRGRGRDAEKPLLDGALDGEGRRRHERSEAEASNHEVEGDGPLRGVHIQCRQQVDAEGHHYRTGDHERFDALYAGYDLAADNPHGRHAEYQRCEHRARTRGCLAEHALHEERSIEDDPEHPDADHEHQQRGGAEDPTLEQGERYYGLGRPELYGYEGGEQDTGDHERDDDAGGIPSVALANPREPKQQRDHRGRNGGGAEVVYLYPEPPGALAEYDGQGEQRKDAERQVDVEDPPPREVVRDPTPHRRTDNAR